LTDGKIRKGGELGGEGRTTGSSGGGGQAGTIIEEKSLNQTTDRRREGIRMSRWPTLGPNPSETAKKHALGPILQEKKQTQLKGGVRSKPDANEKTGITQKGPRKKPEAGQKNGEKRFGNGKPVAGP